MTGTGPGVARRAGGWGSVTASLLRRVLPVPAGARRAALLVERNALAYRHGWALVLSGFFEPVFYLLSLGVGIGALVGDLEVDGVATAYPVFVAPALLAASAMNGAVMDSTFTVFFKLKYARLYDSVLATPLGPRDVAAGEVWWALLRGMVYAAAFLAVMAVSGVVRSWWALLTVPAATLIGLAFAGAGAAAATYMRSWQDFDLVQLVTLPMFLFSATFFPLSTYPEPLRAVVRLTPLYHGVALERGLALGRIGPELLGHAGYLVGLGVLGMLVAARRLDRLLLA